MAIEGTTPSGDRRRLFSKELRLLVCHFNHFIHVGLANDLFSWLLTPTMLATSLIIQLRANSILNFFKLFGYGDDPNPYTETVDTLEDLVLEFITDMTQRAMDIGRPGRVQVRHIDCINNTITCILEWFKI